jgi:hypothetical protein
MGKGSREGKQMRGKQTSRRVSERVNEEGGRERERS